MEEKVGEFWHKLITKAANKRHPEAAVSLTEVERTVGVMFRALGGDGGLQVEASNPTDHGAKRSLLQMIAGSEKKVELAWRDEESLRLPISIDYFPTKSLNKDLYIWLAALAVGDHQEEEAWFAKNQRLTANTLEAYPGIRSRYKRLVDAHIEQRIPIDKAHPQELDQEKAIRQALLSPGSNVTLPQAKRPPQPVPLWLHPFPPIADATETNDDPEGNEGSNNKSKDLDDGHKKRGERAKAPGKKDQGLITIRMENIFSWGEMMHLDRSSEDNDDLEDAADAAKDMDTISVSRDAKTSAGKLRFDLDLPSEANDDLVLNEGLLLPEWNYKKSELQPDYCRIVPMLAKDPESTDLPIHLHKTARKLKAQFQHLAPARVWHREQQEGCEIDMDAYLRFATDRAAGRVSSPDGLYRDLRVGARDLACLLLADLSLSTDSWVNNHQRVIDVIQDALFLFSESLNATGDDFAMYGFSSRKRDPIRVHQLKTFDEAYNASIRGRISAIKPGYYTRMGAAIRYSSSILKGRSNGRRLLLILTDGKPNDLDRYEGRYGIEDTRKAIQEARELGLEPFCVTIDAEANDYLPHIFGSGSYVVIHKPSQLPKELPLLYARLTA